jgi:hypothetical protein
MRSKTALRRDPSKPQTGGGLTQSLQRLSPGVYRDAGGRLTNQSGRALPQQPNRQQPPMEWQLQRPQNMNPMQRPQGPLTDPGFMQTSIGQPAQLPPGSNAYDYAGAMAKQRPEQQTNPSMQPWNYQPGTYRPWYLPPQNAPWWTQPRQPEQPQAQQPEQSQQPQIENKPGQPMSFEEFVRAQMGR